MRSGFESISTILTSCQTHSVQQPPHEVHLGGGGAPT